MFGAPAYTAPQVDIYTAYTAPQVDIYTAYCPQELELPHTARSSPQHTAHCLLPVAGAQHFESSTSEALMLIDTKRCCYRADSVIKSAMVLGSTCCITCALTMLPSLHLLLLYQRQCFHQHNASTNANASTNTMPLLTQCFSLRGCVIMSVHTTTRLLHCHYWSLSLLLWYSNITVHPTDKHPVAQCTTPPSCVLNCAWRRRSTVDRRQYVPLEVVCPTLKLLAVLHSLSSLQCLKC